MKIKAILFDLDGTLLPMNEEIFIKGYFKMLVTKLAPLGYDSNQLIKAIWSGIQTMIKSDGSKLNREVFWESFAQIFGEKVYEDSKYFDDFYNEDFPKTIKYCGFTPLAKETIEIVKSKGLISVLATNPVFPSIATENRIRFAGLVPEDFVLYTTYDNSNYCKPNLNYYKEILSKIDCNPEECLMVGNNVSEDMVAEQLGMKVFLLTDCLINREDTDITAYEQGDFNALISYIKAL